MERLEEVIVPRDHRFPLLDSDLHVLCVPSLRDELVEIYRTHDWVYDLVREQSGVGELRGRHPVLTGEIGGRKIVAKRLFHGGSTARLWEDRWLGPGRALDFVDAARHLYEHGIPTPELLFLSWIRRSGFVRVEIGFERLIGRDADHYFFEAATLPEDWREKARKIGALAASLHDSHFEHGDLNMMNIFFTEEGDIYILDLDKCELHDDELDESTRIRNLSRLERSIRKQGRIHGYDHQLVDDMVKEVRSAYEESAEDRG
ncbi:MAG: lipopolysaccharide kinase InaA family protein [Thermoanaerobaculia bacterium]|nr:lipopolysaccharide kinase InaA family protein [Thermoanaerobaculia bacterium]